ncbi:MAG: uroporphyrinogen decarboxylase family protein [Phycisphaerae bacterium]
MVDDALARAEKYYHGVLDGFALCSDYCLNTGPFLSPAQFSEFVSPYLDKLIAGYRQMGFYTIKHTDGNIMPIIDQLVQCRPHALHSLDPQAGVDITTVKKKYGKQVCLMVTSIAASWTTGRTTSAPNRSATPFVTACPAVDTSFPPATVSTRACGWNGMK